MIVKRITKLYITYLKNPKDYILKNINAYDN